MENTKKVVVVAPTYNERGSIEKTNGFREFIKANSDSYLGIAFFVIDFQNDSASQRSLDYYMPSTKKIASFDLSGNYKVSEQLVEKRLDPLDDVRLGIEEVIAIIREELNKKEILLGIQKVIAVLQKKDLEVVWSVNVILTNTDFIKIRIRDNDSTISKFELINLMSLISTVKKPAVGEKLEFYDVTPNNKVEGVKKLEDGSEGNLG